MTTEQLTLEHTCRHGSHRGARCSSIDAIGASRPNVGTCHCCGCDINLWGTGLGYPSCRRCHAGEQGRAAIVWSVTPTEVPA